MEKKGRPGGSVESMMGGASMGMGMGMGMGSPGGMGGGGFGGGMAGPELVTWQKPAGPEPDWLIAGKKSSEAKRIR